MSNHTPGTWEAKDQWGYIKVHSADNGVCVIHGLDSKAQANARLIASAPDMLDALQAIVDAFGDRDSILIDQCKAALNKAKGIK